MEFVRKWVKETSLISIRNNVLIDVINKEEPGIEIGMK